MTRETIEKLPLVLSATDLTELGFSQRMVYNKIFKDPRAGVIKIGNKRMVQRDEFFKWLDDQSIVISSKIESAVNT